MAKNDEPTVIKKYANRRLYNTGTSTYVTLEDLAKMVKDGEDFVVQDAKSGQDLTHAVLTQIIFEQEGKSGQSMLPISVLRQLISFYGDQMQMVLPSYLEHSMALFSKEQERLREQMTSMVGKSPIDLISSSQQMIEEQTRRNMEMFRNAMQMFSPFAGGNGTGDAPAEPKKGATSPEDLKSMRDQIAEMQRKLDSMEE
ncbi:polyhydroxyalkanoate synthesis repressor PhaR [Oricola cellulosilytica]|uniref:Polyhydroxyalkanoate synthesis repressor PhaR n=1 Tax=Oricola cellulosilytica TaxID=1429082 RepID=A0A4R0P9L7_9HYPH|nr:polyhydroxyalkanoate synthesis repressor PhaR [Oricola cellulosilytica]TCD13860.1 polyhydroxyalkanoate synthesis repressor PhaR [Oricola cellulosilytica]